MKWFNETQKNGECSEIHNKNEEKAGSTVYLSTTGFRWVRGQTYLYNQE